MVTFDNGHALVIGIADYHVGALSLPSSVTNDAKDVATVLQAQEYCGLPSSNVRVLLDQQATLKGVRDALAALALGTDQRSVVTIFFSGHGARIGLGDCETSALVPFDCRLENMDDSVLAEAEFSEALAAIKARRLLVLIDACHAGGVGVFKTHQGGTRLGFGEKSLRQLAQGTGRVLIASSRADETSAVMRGARNSVFTEHLLGALEGRARTAGDGLIRVFDVFNHVSEHVRSSVRDQHPIFKASDLEDNFPIVLDRGGTKSQSVPARSKVDRWREIEEIMADLYPAGPTDQDIWARADGDVSRLRLGASGRANWFAALRALRLGGGGQNIDRGSLLAAALDDFPHHPELCALKAIPSRQEDVI